MGDVTHWGRSLFIAGILIAGIGGVMMLGGKLPWLGRLPGDIMVKRENFTFYFPVATGILLSLVLSLVLWLLGKK